MLGRALMLAVLVAAGPAVAQPVTTTTTPAPAPQVDQGLGVDTPRSTVRGFLAAADDDDWARAAEHLDLRGQPSDAGPLLARQLDTVMRRTLWLDLDALSTAPEGDEDDGLKNGRDLVGSIHSRDGLVRVFVDRIPAADGTPEWCISRSVVQQVPRLYAEFGDGPLAAWLPAPFFAVRFLDVQLWQWIGLAVVAAASLAGAALIVAAVVRIATPIAHRARARVTIALLERLASPARLALGVAIATAALPFLRLSVGPGRVVAGILSGGTTIAVTWVLLRATDAVARAADLRLADQAAAAGLVPLARRSAKAVIVTVAALAVLQRVGFNVTGLIAGLGVGGLAVALAAQKTLENLFGGLSIVGDAPVRIGDFCRFGDRTGTVEDIGLRSVRLRTPERTIITVPNGVFAGMQIENFGARDRTLFETRLQVRPDVDVEELRTSTQALCRILLDHPEVDAAPVRVRVATLTAAAIELEVLAYVRTTDTEHFASVREALLLALLERLGTLRAGVPVAAPAPPTT